MARDSSSMEDALCFVQSKRPFVSPNAGFLKQLRSLQPELCMLFHNSSYMLRAVLQDVWQGHHAIRSSYYDETVKPVHCPEAGLTTYKLEQQRWIPSLSVGRREANSKASRQRFTVFECRRNNKDALPHSNY
eukprot:5066673-Pleurochrysis_carterae.AAC.1